MDLTTTYLGLSLAHPVVPGASPLTATADGARRLEDAGAPALVLPSLFAEEIEAERAARQEVIEAAENSFAEALTYFPRLVAEADAGAEAYLERVRTIKEAVGIPVIASLNGSAPGDWTAYARQIQEAGADALELNVFFLATDPAEGPEQVDDRVVQVVSSVVRAVSIPVAVKLSPFFSSLPNLLDRLAAAGAKAAVLFNRFYQPDLDLDRLEVVPRLRLSDPGELGLRIRWAALLWERVPLELAVTGGVHTADDAAKALLCGATAVQTASALLRHGPARLTEMVEGLRTWVERRGYASLAEARGALSAAKAPDPAALVRANYARVLRSGP
ncbi:dihydroorotate dehydrogenase-like protein [Deferrisoma sp.]